MVTATKISTLIVSADSHVDEPPDLWAKRLPAHLRERAPRQEVRDGSLYQVIEGLPLRKLAPTGQVEASKRRGATDIAQRRRDMELDGVSAEVIYPGIGLFTTAIPDPELQVACARVYNDWAHETFGAHFDMFMPAPIIPAVDVEASVAEIERVAEMGFRLALMAAHAPGGRSYNDPAYEPVWAAAEAAGLPISFHTGTGKDPVAERGPGGAVINYVDIGNIAQRTVTYLCASGVLARHPNLHVSTVEAGSGWLAWVLERMDEAYAEHQSYVRPKLDLRPSDYYRRQGHVSFQFDRAGLATVGLVGPDCLIWGSDYPHDEGTWPHSQEKLAEQFRGIPDEITRKIVGETAAKLYRFPVGRP